MDLILFQNKFTTCNFYRIYRMFFVVFFLNKGIHFENNGMSELDCLKYAQSPFFPPVPFFLNNKMCSKAFLGVKIFHLFFFFK